MSGPTSQRASADIRRPTGPLTATRSEARFAGSPSQASYFHLDPLDLPPFPEGMTRGDSSPDSNDQDHDFFITPANSARPSVAVPFVRTEGSASPPTGLGIGLGEDMTFPPEHNYYLDKEMGREAEDINPNVSKPPLPRSKSTESTIQARRSQSQAASSIQAHPEYAKDPSHPASLSPDLSTSHTLSNPRPRISSPNRLASFAEQQAGYLPEQLHLPPFSSGPSQLANPTVNGKPSNRTPLNSSDSLSPTTLSPYSEAARSRNIRNTPKDFPPNVPTGHDVAAGRQWHAGDGRTKHLSGEEKGFALSSRAAPEKEKFTDSQAYWLGLYFIFNLGLTLFNKFVLVSFPFPYTLTGLHALSGCVGCYIALERGAFVPARLTQRENVILAAFSVLYTINIAVSNISLQLVTVPFHQVVRASTPFFTILTSATLLGTRFSIAKMVALLPVVAGVGFATYGDYYFTAWGLILTLLGTFLAALKTVATNLIQTGGGGRLKLHPLDLLMRMSPLAFVQCVVYGWYTGELDRVRTYGATQMNQTKAIALVVNGVIACGLNIVSFTANKKSGPLTMTVSANCKQVMTIALAVVLFDLHISFMNAIGILLTLVGGATYGLAEYRERNRRPVKLERA